MLHRWARQIRLFHSDTINPFVLQAQYAVRGELVIRADALRNVLKKKDHNLPFNQVISCNIGNPQELGQVPLTFFRQVLALCQYPALLEAKEHFPKDAIARAKRYLDAIPGGVGAYSGSSGLKIVRDEIAQFIEARDGYPCDPESLFLTDGASPAIKYLLQILIRPRNNDGILTPIPQYPLYSASITLLDGQRCGYYLDESNGWSLSAKELERAYEVGKKSGVNPRGIVIINPGNPTGQCLTASNMEEVVDFAHSKKLVILADEVYQENIYSKTPFTSFKKVVKSMGKKYESVQLASFHSVSKGFLGECGQRGGYTELVGFDPAVHAAYYKLASISLCPNLSGQIMVGLMVNPPKKGDESYSLYTKQRDAILQSLARRAKKIAEVFNKVPGVTCNAVEGALYAFPQIRLPSKLVDAAKKAGKSPDTFYCLALLENTGICVVPGSGFDQQDGTWHFRTTILPAEKDFEVVLDKFAKFHQKFIKQYE